MHTLIFLTIYAQIELNSIFHINVNAQYEDIFTNSKKNTGHGSAVFELVKYGLTCNNI